MNIWEGFCEQITRQQLLMLLNSICFHEKYWKLCQLLTCVQGLLWKAQIRLDLYLLYTLYSVEQPKSVWWNLKKSVYIKFHHDLCQDRPKYLHLNVWPTFFYRWWIMGVLSSVVSPICYFHCFRWVVIWVRFCRTGKMPDLRPFFFKSRGFVWPNLMRYF